MSLQGQLLCGVLRKTRCVALMGTTWSLSSAYVDFGPQNPHQPGPHCAWSCDTGPVVPR